MRIGRRNESCRLCRDSASDLLAGLLDEAMRASIKAHLAHCPSCERFSRDLDNTIAALSALSESTPTQGEEQWAKQLFAEYYPEPDLNDDVSEWTRGKQLWGRLASLGEAAFEEALKSEDECLDPALCDWLMARARRMSSEKPVQAVPIARKALQLARARDARVGDTRRLLLALDALTCCLLTVRDFSSLEALLRETRRLCQGEDLRGEEKARVNTTFGLYYSYTGQLDKAEQYLTEALEYRRKAGDRRKLLTQLINFAGAVTSPGEGKRALEFCHEALALLRPESDPPRVQIALYCNYVLAYCETGQTDRAREILPRVVNLAETVGGWFISTSVVWLGGTVARAEGDYVRASRIFEAVRSEFLTKGQLYWFVEASLDLARVFLLEGRFSGLAEIGADLVQKCEEMDADEDIRVPVLSFVEAVKQRSLSSQMLRSVALALGPAKVVYRV